MTERIAPVAHEGERTSSDLLGLQARLLIGGEALNPQNLALPVVTSEQLGTFDTRDYGVFVAISGNERRQYWEGKNGDHKEVWKRNFKEKLVSGATFFATEHGAHWGEFLAAFGSAEHPFDVSEPRDEAIEALYSRYFVGDERKSHIKQYVGDVLRIFQGADGIPNPVLMHRYSDVITWMGSMFGEHSGQIVTLLAAGEAILQVPGGREAIVLAVGVEERANIRMNRLDPEEDAMLSFLWENRAQRTVPVQLPPREPQVPQPAGIPHEVPTPVVHEPHAIARTLLNYETGTAHEQHDLSAVFPDLVVRVERLIEENEDIFPPGVRAVVLSDVAVEMIRAISEKSHERDVELAFEMHGIAIVQGDKEVGVAAFAVPTMDFTHAEQLRVITRSDIHEAHANQLTDNTNLGDYFRSRSHTRNGNLLLSCHTHQRQAGVPIPSQQDLTQFAENATNSGEQQVWAIFTLRGEELLSTTRITYRDGTGTIRHSQNLLLKDESDLPLLDVLQPAA